MLYLHICMPSKRMMETFISMTRKSMPQDEHKFIFWDTCYENDLCLLDYGNVVALNNYSMKKRRKIMYEEFKKADVLVWHGLILSGRQILMLYLNPSFCKKSVWIVHGIDMYNYVRNSKGFKSSFLNHINYSVRKSMPYVVCLTEDDAKIYKSKFGSCKQLYVIPKPISADVFEQFLPLRNAKDRLNNQLYIQVAHNAYTFNNHIPVMKSLLKFKDENIKLVIPLSYGNDWVNAQNNYINEVIKFAKSAFSNKAECINKLMPQDEYNNLLWNVDVGVFGATRQNAMGNILRLLLVGNKVFLPSDSPLYHYLTENGVEIYDTNAIDKMSFEEFKQKSPCTTKTATFICKLYHPDCSAFRWKYLYEDVAYRLGLSKQKPSQLDEERLTAIASGIIKKNKQLEITKENYVCLRRYQLQKKGTVMKNCRNVMIMGSGALAIEVMSAMLKDNAIRTRWFNYGFSSYAGCIRNNTMDIDVVGSPETSAVKNVSYVSAVINPYERKYFADKLEERGAVFRNYAFRGAICKVFSVGMGCLFGPKVKLNFSTKIGKHCYLFGEEVGKGVEIKDYVTVLEDTVINDNVIIDSFAIIGKRVEIAEGVHIGKGAYIPNDSIITEDVPSSDGINLNLIESDVLRGMQQ